MVIPMTSYLYLVDYVFIHKPKAKSKTPTTKKKKEKKGKENRKFIRKFILLI